MDYGPDAAVPGGKIGRRKLATCRL
jgi:hypothetical protein